MRHLAHSPVTTSQVNEQDVSFLTVLLAAWRCAGDLERTTSLC